jgi:hypothetical protein
MQHELRIAMALLSVAAPMAAQDSTLAPFSRVDVSLRALALVSTDTLATFYRSGPAAEFLVETPYHSGTLSLGLQVNRYVGTPEGAPGFTGLFPFIGWGAVRPLPGGMDVVVGTRIGALGMIFDPPPDGPRTRELELGWGVDAGLRRALGRRFIADVSVHYRRITSAPETGEWRIGGGIGARLHVPGAVQDILLARPQGRYSEEFARPTTPSWGLGEVVRLFDGWDRSTLDGVSWSVSARGLSPLDAPGWRVTLDRMPIALGLLGTRDPGRLLLPPWFLTGATAQHIPSVAAGGFYKAGGLHVRVPIPPAGLSIRVTGEAGNETGDPGPFFSTPLEGENVDKLGPRAAAEVSYRAGQFSLAGGLTQQAHSVVASVLHLRDRGIPADRYPFFQRRAPYASIGWHGASGTARVVALRSSADEVLFLPAWGRERFGRTELSFEGLHASYLLGRGVQARAAASRSLNEFRPVEAPGLEWSITDRWALVEISAVGRRGLTAGASLHHRSARSGAALEDSSDAFQRLYASHVLEAGRGWRLTVGGEATGSARQWAGSVTGGISRQWGDSAEAGITLGRISTLPAEEETFWLWTARGYPAVGTAAAPVRSRLLTVDALVRWRWSRGTSLSVEPFARRIAGQPAALAQFEWDSAGRVFTSPIRHAPDTRGSVVGGVLTASHELAGGPEGRASYRYQAAVGGDSAFRATWGSTPRHEFRLFAGIPVAPDLALWSRIDFQSSRQWANWERLVPRDGVPWGPGVPAHWMGELSIRKLFGSVVSTSVTVRAPLGGRVQYHPLGIRSRLQLWVAGELTLGARAATQ